MLEPYYQHDGQTIYHGDCREILPELEPVDLVLADPPYSISGGGVHKNLPGKGSRKLDFFDCDFDWERMTATVVESIGMCLELAPTIFCFCGHRQFGGIVDLLERKGFKTRPFGWEKMCPIPSPPHTGFDSAFELAVVGTVAGRIWNPLPGDKAPNLLRYDSYRHGNSKKVNHPTQKPTALCAKLITWMSSDVGVVLDPFMGSGTTLVAAKLEGRQAIGIELEEKYCEIAANRLRQGVLQFTG